ncbi:MAG: NAD(P)/FAD-dependent oxidoreductase [Campylobacteraceae bacterium]|nr:NAD(P)/FAD-dependent oxidoreductase [Campylobacteraceae bacterium]MBT3881996.1 NAD(P)/FAD-dependent oxidoreductase [Campylobacteraceae bacterium]MBT4030002.1 NAD(P)/FAD-dependent oxidoreductase [Campylobacteraceae bacterium]MBT4179962.1 NAD(P)/FAD-dependent oxidoreductase [Campylobacteraceae bacterium]MBT4572266.1 NAD(P)/FAD-dependent oxidoreductase [Campylobacteraceae bacterium]
MSMTRRDILKALGLLVSTTATASITKNSIIKKSNPQRVVIVGGGWSGLSIAKNIKMLSKETDVLLVEQNDKFISCPMSNLWLVDKVSLEYLTHDYEEAANNNNYTFLNAKALDLDKKNNILHTTSGDLNYDYIIFAPGIDYDYSFLTNNNLVLERRLRQEYPAGFKHGTEQLTLKNKIQNFKNGNFIMTVPAGNYRCLPAPYERACLVADYFKSKNINAKVILLDENNDITIKEHGFHTAFEELYSGYLEYYPNSKIEYIDLDEKFIETEFQEFYFDDASFYPRVKGAKILEKVGIAKDTVFNRLEGNIDGLTYQVIGEENIFISGDARPMGFSKSGNTSSTEGLYVAKLVVNKINNNSHISWESPTTLCFSAVSVNPEQAIFINSQYSYNKKSKTFGFATPKTSEVWKGNEGLENAKAQYNWADAMYKYMFK